MDILGTLQKLSMESGFAAFFVTDGGWKNLIMIIIAFVLLYLGIVKKFEPLLLCGIAFGCLLTNLSYFIGMGENALYHPELWEAFLDEASPYYHSYGHVMSNAGLLDFFYIGVKAGISVAVLLLIASFGCYAFIRAGVYNAAMDKLLEEGDYTRENKRKSPVFGAISTAYWLVVTALFLYLSFGPSGNGQPGTLWYIWAVAGVLYGAIVAFKNVFVRKGGKR